MPDETVVHEIVKTPDEELHVEAVADAAETAVALAHATAAAAELDAAERVREIEGEADEWRNRMESQTAELGTALHQQSENVASLISRLEGQSSANELMLARLQQMEDRLENLQPPIPPTSEPEAEATAEAEAEAEAEQSGSASGETSLVSVETAEPEEARPEPPSAPARKRRRWI